MSLATAEGLPSPGGTTPMNTIHLPRALEDFFVLQSSPRSQTGILHLERGRATVPECDPERDRGLLLIEGELVVEVEDTGQTIRPGVSLTIPAGVKHRVINRSARPALAFTVVA
jgi:mannose-6-phosphate isomerase-like protein (cupin superfamily)